MHVIEMDEMAQAMTRGDLLSGALLVQLRIFKPVFRTFLLRIAR
jgi:hypothetical protein